jgi:hypothetical protein
LNCFLRTENDEEFRIENKCFVVVVFKNVLHWYKDGIQIARDSEIINQEYIEIYVHSDAKLAKYDVILAAAEVSNYTGIYTLTIYR